MGNSICRLILAKGTTSDAVAFFASVMRAKVKQPTSLYLRDLRGRQVRDLRLVAARDAELRILDISPATPPDTLAAIAASTFGQGRFIVRVADDEDEDATIPASTTLAQLYPGVNLDWVLMAEDRPFPWNSEPFFVCPGNPANWSLKIPLMATLLLVASPGQVRPCPGCRTPYTSKGDRGQCPSCGFVAWSFRTVSEARSIRGCPLDAFAWGRCPRCRKSREFTYRIEQCFRCGQLLEGDPGRHTLTLIANKGEVASLLASLDLK